MGAIRAPPPGIARIRAPTLPYLLRIRQVAPYGNFHSMEGGGRVSWYRILSGATNDRWIYQARTSRAPASSDKHADFRAQSFQRTGTEIRAGPEL